MYNDKNNTNKMAKNSLISLINALSFDRLLYISIYIHIVVGGEELQGIENVW